MLGFILSCACGQNTYSQWAFQISLLSGCNVSKQAVFDRISEKAVGFAKELLQYFLLQQTCRKATANLFAGFGKVLLHDSTTLHLPQGLNSVFKGNHSLGEQKAVARIQTVIDITRMRFLHFSLGSFTDNDQSASGSILPWVNKADLVIRDLGYFTLKSFEQLVSKQAYFLSRLRFGVNIYDQKGQRLSLKTLMQGRQLKDQWVYIGEKRKIKVRLIMIPLPAAQTAEKIRKAKHDRDKRLHHSREYYQWLGYTVLITNVEQQVWTPQQAAQAYRVRWQIEIIFKSWKSCFHMQRLLHEGCTNADRVKVNIYLLLLFICLFMLKLYIPYRTKMISLFKLSKYVLVNLQQILSLSYDQLKQLILKHCCYDKRSDRLKMTDLYRNLT